MGAIALMGCSRRVITLIDEVMVVPQGSELSENIADYVRASKKMLEGMTIDLSRVNTEILGDYKVTVTYGKEEREFIVRVADTTAPVINLIKSDFYIENEGELKALDVIDSVEDFSKYSVGFSDSMTKADLDKRILDSLYFDKIGEQRVEIIARDIYDNISVKEVTVHVVTTEDMPGDADEYADYGEYMNHSKGVSTEDLTVYDDAGVYYGLGSKRDAATNRPNLAYYTNKYSKYAVDFIQPNSKYVWLTFNEASETGNTAKLLDTLKEKEVSAVFFVTLSYAQENPKLIKRMLDEGHVIGNYTATYAKVPDLSLNDLTSELTLLYNYLQDTYGYDMYLFRTPSGYFSERVLAAAQKYGMRTVFWSYSYIDWDSANQPEAATALTNALNSAHGGAIYSYSGSSSTNRDMMADFIDGIREKNLEFAVYQKN